MDQPKIKTLPFTALNIILLLIGLLLIASASAAEQRLRLLVWEGYAPTDQVQRFEGYIAAKYRRNVRLEVKHVSNPKQFFNAVRGKKADIISPAHNLINDHRFNFIKNKLFLPIKLEHIPNYEEIVPALKQIGALEKNGEIYGVPFICGPYGLAYNTELIDAPTSWNLLWDPAFKNRYAINGDYYELNIYITALALGYTEDDLYRFDTMNTHRFKQRLHALIKNALG